MIDINIEKSLGLYNCFEYAMIKTAAYYRLDFSLMFSDCWGFEYNKKAIRLSNMYRRRNYSPIRNLEAYHGIKFRIIDTDTDVWEKGFNNILDQIQKEKPVIIMLNSYWRPWGGSYKEITFVGDGEFKKGVKRRGHIVLIIGYNKNEKIFYCKDGAVGDKIQVLPIDDFINGCVGVLVHEIINKKVNTKEEYNEIIKNALKYVKNNNCGIGSFEGIKKVAEFFKSGDYDIETEIKGISNITYAPVFRNFYSLHQADAAFAECLRHIGEKEKNDKILEASKKLFFCHTIWETIFNLFRKAYIQEDIIKKNKSIEKCVSYLYDLAKYEEEVFNNLNSLY